MTLLKFLLLNAEGKTNAVLRATYLDVRAQDDYNVLLFDMGGFYAEMFYAPGLNEIAKFEVFRSTNLLKPYLDEMCIAEQGIFFEKIFW